MMMIMIMIKTLKTILMEPTTMTLAANQSSFVSEESGTAESRKWGQALSGFSSWRTKSYTHKDTGASYAESVSISSRGASTMSGAGGDRIADEIIQQRTEELSNVVAEKLGQAFAGLSLLVENAIFPVNADEHLKESTSKKQNHR